MSRIFAESAHALPLPLPALHALSPCPTARQKHEESATLAMLAESTQ